MAVLRPELIKRDQQHLYLEVLGLADVEDNLLKPLFLTLKALRLLHLLLELQVLALELAVVGP